MNLSGNFFSGTMQVVAGRAKVLPYFTLAMVVASLVGLMLAAKPAYASTFTVNTTASDDDGRCQQPVFFNPLRDCTLREAIQRANSNNGPNVVDTINFKIPGSGVRTIRPTSGLPPITDPVIIDGYSQPGTSPNTLADGNNAKLLIELNGTNAGSFASGLVITAKNSVVKGLAINRFSSVGIIVLRDPGSEEATGNRIEGNFLGTDPSGTVDRGNRFDGVFIDDTSGPNNTIGGTSPEKRNVLSGNGGFGVFLDGAGSKVEGNFIGTEKDGTSDLGNGHSGVGLNRKASNNTIGGDTTGAANTIAFNDEDGIEAFNSLAFTPTGNRILGNSIFSNGDLGIDLNADGRTQNDGPDDSDTGPNDLQNFPGITSATRSPSTPLTIQGRLNSTPNKSFTIQFFANPQGEEDEGRDFLGEQGVSTNSNGRATFAFVAPRPVPVGSFITATATGSGGTSEFSEPQEVVQG